MGLILFRQFGCKFVHLSLALWLATALGFNIALFEPRSSRLNRPYAQNGFLTTFGIFNPLLMPPISGVKEKTISGAKENAWQLAECWIAISDKLVNLAALSGVDTN